MMASMKGHFEVARLMCEAGADVDKARNDGTTPFKAASEEGHLQVVRLLEGWHR